MSHKIFKVDEMDLNNINYFSPKKILANNKNFLFIPMVYNENMPILIQLPSIKLNDSYKKDVLILPIKTTNINKTLLIKTFFNNLDNKILTDFKAHGKKWCKEIPQILKNIDYRAVINEIDDEEDVYDNGILSLQLEDINNTLFGKNLNSYNNDIKVYNEKKELILNTDYESVLQKGNFVQCIIEFRGLIITQNENSSEIIPYIKVHQIRYSEEKIVHVNLDSYSFLESEVEPRINKQTVNKMNVINEENNSEDNNVEEQSEHVETTEEIEKIMGEDDTSDEEDDGEMQDSDDDSDEESEEETEDGTEIEVEMCDSSDDSTSSESSDSEILRVLKKPANKTTRGKSARGRGK
jgi:hypothetical protein